jgi:broad specificity phosphatase PhoE
MAMQKPKIEHLVINTFPDNKEGLSSFFEEYLPTSSPDTLNLTYKKDYDHPDPDTRQYRMLYPEDITENYFRYLTFFRKVRDRHLNNFLSDSDGSFSHKVIILVSHGQSIPSFMELCDPLARQKDVIGVGYCCVSLIHREGEEGTWEQVCLGDATHVECGTSEVYPRDMDY